MVDYEIIPIIIGAVFLYLIISYLDYRVALNRLSKKREIITKKTHTQLIFLSFCWCNCLTSIFLLLNLDLTADLCICSSSVSSLESSESDSIIIHNKDSKLEERDISTSSLKKEILTIEETKSRITSLITDKNFVSINWISAITLIPIETVFNLISQEEFYQIEGDKVIRRKIKTGICPECSGHYSTYTEYCPNCGENIIKKE